MDTNLLHNNCILTFKPPLNCEQGMDWYYDMIVWILAGNDIILSTEAGLIWAVLVRHCLTPLISVCLNTVKVTLPQ